MVGAGRVFLPFVVMRNTPKSFQEAAVSFESRLKEDVGLSARVGS